MRTLIFTSFFCIFIGCSTKEPVQQSPQEKLSASFISTLHQLNPEEDTKKYAAYMLIPNTGCSGCINSAEAVLKNMYQKTSKVKFILTNVVSVKTVQVKLGINVTNNENILVDKDNLFEKSEFNSIYPQVFFVDKSGGKILRKMEVSPKEDGLLELNKIL
jgi:hypothetical protein